VETCLLVAIIDSYCLSDQGTTMLTRSWLALAIVEAFVACLYNNYPWSAVVEAFVHVATTASLSCLSVLKMLRFSK
jgi:hypothetical protein